MKLTEEGYWIPKNIVFSSKLEKAKCKNILSKGGWFVRNTYNFDKKVKSSFWYVVKDVFGGLDELTSKKRNQVKKSLRTYEFKIINIDEFKRFGLDIENRARVHYAVKAAMMNKKHFEARLQREVKEGGYEYWGVYKRDTQELVGFSINKNMYGYCFYEYIRILPECLGNTYPYYGLFYTMNKYYLEEMGAKFVSDGSRSITEHSNIQPFLINTFNFRKAYCDLQVEYKWWLKIFVTILFPFRKFMPMKAKAVLNLEAMNRGLI